MKRIILGMSVIFILSGCESMKAVGDFLSGIGEASVTTQDGKTIGIGCNPVESAGTVCEFTDRGGKVWRIKYNSKGEQIDKTEVSE